MAAAGSAEAQLVQHRMQQSGQDDADDLDDLSLAWKRAGEVTPRPLADDASRWAALLTPVALCVAGGAGVGRRRVRRAWLAQERPGQFRFRHLRAFV